MYKSQFIVADTCSYTLGIFTDLPHTKASNTVLTSSTVTNTKIN